MKQTKKAIQFFFIVILLLVFALTSCVRGQKGGEREPLSQSELLLGTVSRITLYDNQREDLFALAFNRIKEIEDEMDFHTLSSDVAHVNREAFFEPVKVSNDTFKVVKEALAIAALSNGAFDITVGPLVEAWDIGGDNPRRPPQSEIDALLKLIDYRNVRLDEDDTTIQLLKEGMKIDLGGIAKGFAADEAAKVLKENGVDSAIINLGGNVLTVGNKPDGSQWRIGIQNPLSERGGHVMIINVGDKTLVTSGPYERFFEDEGVIYHHILDTQTGYPVDTDILSVSIITDESMYADALSTALYSLGLQKGMALINSLEGVDAIFIDNKHKIFLSKGLEEGAYSYTISDPQFSLGKIE